MKSQIESKLWLIFRPDYTATDRNNFFSRGALYRDSGEFSGRNPKRSAGEYSRSPGASSGLDLKMTSFQPSTLKGLNAFSARGDLSGRGSFDYKSSTPSLKQGNLPTISSATIIDKPISSSQNHLASFSQVHNSPSLLPAGRLSGLPKTSHSIDNNIRDNILKSARLLLGKESSKEKEPQTSQLSQREFKEQKEQVELKYGVYTHKREKSREEQDDVLKYVIQARENREKRQKASANKDPDTSSSLEQIKEKQTNTNSMFSAFMSSANKEEKGRSTPASESQSLSPEKPSLVSSSFQRRINFGVLQQPKPEKPEKPLEKKLERTFDKQSLRNVDSSEAKSFANNINININISSGQKELDYRYDGSREERNKGKDCLDTLKKAGYLDIPLLSNTSKDEEIKEETEKELNQASSLEPQNKEYTKQKEDKNNRNSIDKVEEEPQESSEKDSKTSKPTSEASSKELPSEDPLYTSILAEMSSLEQSAQIEELTVQIEEALQSALLDRLSGEASLKARQMEVKITENKYKRDIEALDQKQKFLDEKLTALKSYLNDLQMKKVVKK